MNYLIAGMILLISGTAGALDFGDAPIDVTSDELAYFQEQNRAVFDGNVTVVHGPIILKADDLEIVYSNVDENVETITATGAVSVEHDINKATGDKAVYDPDTGYVSLTGNVVMIRENNTLTGDALLYDPKNGTMKLTHDETADDQVRASFTIQRDAPAASPTVAVQPLASEVTASQVFELEAAQVPVETAVPETPVLDIFEPVISDPEAMRPDVVEPAPQSAIQPQQPQESQQ